MRQRKKKKEQTGRNLIAKSAICGRLSEVSLEKAIPTLQGGRGFYARLHIGAQRSVCIYRSLSMIINVSNIS
jgi:hypothetical protein